MATEKQYLFASGRVTENVQRTTVKPTRWEILSKGIPEAEWMQNEALCDFASRHRNHYFVPERFLNALRLETEYDGESSVYSIVKGVVIPESEPLQEVETADATPQNN